MKNKEKDWFDELFSEFFHFLFQIASILLIPALIILNWNSISSIRTSAALNNENYNESVSSKTMAYLCAEASYDYVGWFYKQFMPVRNNQVSGWTHVTEGRDGWYSNVVWSGLEWALWVNDFNKNTYCLVYAGTDEIPDMLNYIDMELAENYCPQMIGAVGAAKSIKSHVQDLVNSKPNTYGTMTKLYITGHSLGGYLASYITSEMIDYYYGGSESNSNIRLSDVSNNLDIEDLHCVTFGAPGMYHTDDFSITYGQLRNSSAVRKFGSTVADLIERLNTHKYNAIETEIGWDIHLTSWEVEKNRNNLQNLYYDHIINYVNNRDFVGNLVQQKMGHLGRVIYNDVNRYDSSSGLQFILKKAMQAVTGLVNTVVNSLELLGFVNLGGSATTGDIYYHMIWIYASISPSVNNYDIT